MSVREVYRKKKNKTNQTKHVASNGRASDWVEANE